MKKHKIGIYEKALPKNITWQERLSLAKACGFEFIEMSIDESDDRLSRLNWTKSERIALHQSIIQSGITIPSMCLSAHRRFPFGSKDKKIRQKSFEIMEKAIDLSVNLGIRTIQLAGYDVYYEKQDEETIKYFQEGIEFAVTLAASAQVTLAVEIMDTPFMSSISRWKKWDTIINSPWFTVYPDIGNLSAWNNNIEEELTLGIDKISAIHLKDTYPVTETSKGQFRDVPFGQGCVDFVHFFSLLKKLNYRGAFLIEMWTEKNEEPLLEIIQARKWIVQQMEKAGLLC
ncbi:TPA: L-ribulose-5-phosphate 3-epimerase [Haemophilus influenzae]|uniref:L-ribulose-5-phosphate 3-epimerase n=1 Tax=Haemophilus TaxID=724 RepID=UPI00014F8440|nr:L-ribulose-5-phosphate 3-epimerase [Haemophilus influenzae]EDJ89463.1 phosphoserine phosphatase [Haemophilus influenzae 22.1-21]AXP38695.1 L-ribulose-5-phosphate 3-epimerase [Haemophilus influenzae]AXP56959.1 L-ribulose-5-phosphate 3-epimerase [Haemophilus influenzae]AXP62117.1 L-ribulose-5-phosphate 3-epimerase [Haemophilus influenzae]AXP67240.1 L-ribulose-5-phosphate 3-epimerase [Haemophilus influenzae]